MYKSPTPLKVFAKNKKNIYLFILMIGIGIIFIYLPFLLSSPRLSSPVTDRNLKNFQELAEKDPLFFDSEMDVDFLLKSVTKMKQQDDLFLSVDKVYRIKEPPEFQLPTGWRIWPDEFLMTLPTIHDATITLLNNPTPRKARYLLVLYKNAVSLYRKAVDLNLQTINLILEKKPELIDRKILYLGSGTTPAIIRNDFILIQDNAVELEREIERRTDCLYRGICITREEKYPSFQKSVKIAFHPLPNDILRIDDLSKVEGPFWTTTSCFGNINSKPLNLPFYLKLKPLKNSKNVRLEAILTNEKYYRDYTQIPNETLAQIQLTNGVKYRPHRETTDYLCSDLTYLVNLFINYFKHSDKSQNKLKTLPYLIENTLAVASFIVDQTKYAKKSFDPLYLLINRSAYSLYFGTFTPTIWRLNKSPTFLLKENFSFRPGYTTYEDLINQGFSKADILHINQVPSIPQIYKEALKAGSK